MVTTILFGLYTAGVAIVITLIEYFTGIDRTGAGNWLGYLSLPFLVLFLWMAMKERKQEDFGGTITYGQCIGTGTLVELFAGIATAIFMYVYFTGINPGIVDYMMQQRQTAMQARQMDPETMRKATSMMKTMFIPFGVGGVLLADVILALIISLIVGAFVKSKEGEAGVRAV